jgi:hypothetical protein
MQFGTYKFVNRFQNLKEFYRQMCTEIYCLRLRTFQQLVSVNFNPNEGAESCALRLCCFTGGQLVYFHGLQTEAVLKSFVLASETARLQGRFSFTEATSLTEQLTQVLDDSCFVVPYNTKHKTFFKK